LTGPDTRAVEKTGMMPPYIPSDATLYLGKDDGWPYKLVLLGRKPSAVYDTRPLGPDGQRIGSRNSIQTVDPTNITLVYTDVQINPKIRIEDFVFQAPGGVPVEDGTETMVKQLDQVIQIQSDRKKQESVKKDVPELPQSLEVPTPPGVPPSSSP
jgi:hypothetical protein